MNDLKLFQRKCAEQERKRKEIEYENNILEQINKKEIDEILEEWELTKQAQERLGEGYTPIQILGGLQKSRCPCCAETLKESIIYVTNLYEYKFLYCLDCGYRFAAKERR